MNFDTNLFDKLCETADEAKIKVLTDQIFAWFDTNNNGVWCFTEVKDMLKEIYKV